MQIFYSCGNGHSKRLWLLLIQWFKIKGLEPLAPGPPLPCEPLLGGQQLYVSMMPPAVSFWLSCGMIVASVTPGKRMHLCKENPGRSLKQKNF